MKYTDDLKKESKKKALLAGAGATGTATLGILGAPVLLIAGAGAGTAYLTYKWFKHRAKSGLRF